MNDCPFNAEISKKPPLSVSLSKTSVEFTGIPSSVPCLYPSSGTSTSSGNFESGNSSSGHSKSNNALSNMSRKRRIPRASTDSYYHSIDNVDKKHVYCLNVRQHPERARAIGFSDKDRRPMDPPAIVELYLADEDGNTVLEPFEMTHLIMHVSIQDVTGKESRDFVLNPFLSQASTQCRTAQVLIGSLVSACYHIMDTKGKRGMFFVFSDLSVRVTGTFRLKFTLIDLRRTNSEWTRTNAKTSILSNPFIVYHPKEFPGLSESTALSKCFAGQGVKINIRTDAKQLKTDEEN